MKRVLMMPLALLSLPSLSGCGQDSVQIVKPPVERLTCAPEPKAPAGSTDRDAAQFMVDIMDAGQNCRNAVAWLKDWSDNLERK